MPFLFGLGADAKKHAKQVHGGYAIKKRLGKEFPKPLRAQKKEKHTHQHTEKKQSQKQKGTQKSATLPTSLQGFATPAQKNLHPTGSIFLAALVCLRQVAVVSGVLFALGLLFGFFVPCVLFAFFYALGGFAFI